MSSRWALHAPMAVVLLVAAFGMERVLTQHWREGAAALGAAMLVAATLRLVLPTDRVGLLAIRGRGLDVLCYAAFGVVMALLAVTITRGSLTPV